MISYMLSLTVLILCSTTVLAYHFSSFNIPDGNEYHYTAKAVFDFMSEKDLCVIGKFSTKIQDDSSSLITKIMLNSLKISNFNLFGMNELSSEMPNRELNITRRHDGSFISPCRFLSKQDEEMSCWNLYDLTVIYEGERYCCSRMDMEKYAVSVLFSSMSLGSIQYPDDQLDGIVASPTRWYFNRTFIMDKEMLTVTLNDTYERSYNDLEHLNRHTDILMQHSPDEFLSIAIDHEYDIHERGFVMSGAIKFHAVENERGKQRKLPMVQCGYPIICDHQKQD